MWGPCVAQRVIMILLRRNYYTLIHYTDQSPHQTAGIYSVGNTKQTPSSPALTTTPPPKPSAAPRTGPL